MTLFFLILSHWCWQDISTPPNPGSKTFTLSILCVTFLLPLGGRTFCSLWCHAQRFQWSAPSCTWTLLGHEIGTREDSQEFLIVCPSLVTYPFLPLSRILLIQSADMLLWLFNWSLRPIVYTQTNPFEIQKLRTWLSYACILPCHSLLEVVCIEYCTCYLNRKKGYRITGGSMCSKKEQSLLYQNTILPQIYICIYIYIIYIYIVID